MEERGRKRNEGESNKRGGKLGKRKRRNGRKTRDGKESRKKEERERMRKLYAKERDKVKNER